MRAYRVQIEMDKVTVYADEIIFKDTWRSQTTEESLVFFEGNRIVAVFKEWRNFIDLGEISPSQVNEN